MNLKCDFLVSINKPLLFKFQLVPLQRGGAAAVGLPTAVPARAATAGAADASTAGGAGGNGKGNPTRSSLMLLPVEPVALPAWFVHGGGSKGGGGARGTGVWWGAVQVAST